MVTLILVLAVGAAVAAAAYAASVAWTPYRDCEKCRGTGIRGRLLTRRHCRRCAGTGHRPRLGLRVWRWWKARGKSAAWTDDVPETRMKVWG